ncbi:hypothetical protein F4778DRAFT_791010 [Xylariomycetidae sp. FL2044]|nr:hypothetical protein F4778DRAFT_791010 [Xylariomycetidae sp. FL2044]
MQVKLALVFCTFVGMIAAKCRGGGGTGDDTPDWPSVDFVKAAVNKVCENGDFNGKYQGNEKRDYKYTVNPSDKNTIVSGNHFRFAIERIKSDQRDLGKDECVDGLSKEVTGCWYGGTSSYTNWKYTSEPFTPSGKSDEKIKDLTVDYH